jgi:hypothetical protein
VLYTGANGNWDDYNTQVTLSFPVVIFGVSSPTIYVSTNGVSRLLFCHVFAG